MEAFPAPTGGASLLLSFRLCAKTVIIVGSSTLAASRAFAALEADSEVIVLAHGGAENACAELRWRAAQRQLTLLDLDALPSSSDTSATDHAAAALDAFLLTTKASLVCVTDTLTSSSRRSRASAAQIARVCQSRGIPINVTDLPDLCDFTFPSMHRFHDPETGTPSPLQLGITTNGQGCRLAGRLRREIVAGLPKEVGSAVRKVGRLRELAKAEDALLEEGDTEQDLSEDGAPSTPNAPVSQRNTEETTVERARRRMKWTAQVSEYWPIPRLAKMTDEDISGILDGRDAVVAPPASKVSAPLEPHRLQHNEISSHHGLSLSPPPRRGKILLVGSGPGHPSLLTMATHAALTKHADLVLSDKLVPAAVLALIPPGVEVRIARKFPGNADGAQAELMEAAIEAAKRGQTVVRLKQGDPTVYGRAGEEVLYFRAHGFEPAVIPGVSSVLAGPTFAGIPVTQRGAAESFIVCTGVGRQGKEVTLPGYERSRTLVLLMGVARLPQVLETLQGERTGRNGPPYPPHTPIALIERASMPDQRVICSTLSDIVAALESVGEQRPPGMLVIGWSVLSLWGEGDMSILEADAEEQDEERVRNWLGSRLWRVTEGLAAEWEGL